MKYFLFIIYDVGAPVLKEYTDKTEFLRDYASEIEKKHAIDIHGFAGEHIAPGFPVTGYRFAIENGWPLVLPSE